MGNASVGIDISSFQSAVPEGPWLFVVHKATEGVTYADSQFAARYPTLSGLRGAYHYARPNSAPGMQQANHFADVVLAAGFKPGVDIWQLDAEDGQNGGAQWQPFIDEFMQVAIARLGYRGLLYAGWPFVQAHGLQATVAKYHWWLPDYSVNDGQVHPVQTPSDFTKLVVLHQFTSAGNLDQNVVQNQATWDALVAPPVTPQYALALTWLTSVAVKPLRLGDKGPRVQELNRLLVRQGYACGGNVFGTATSIALAHFKYKCHLSNVNGNKCGLLVGFQLIKGLQ